MLAWVDYRDSKGKPTNGLVALDTCSSENIFLEASSHPSDIQVETVVSVCGGQAKLGPSANFIMLRHATHEVGAVLFGSVGTNDEATGHIPRDCVALLGRHAIRDLQVDLNYHNLSTEIEQLSVISPESYVSEKFVRQVMDQKQREAPVDPSLHIQVSDDVPLSEWHSRNTNTFFVWSPNCQDPCLGSLMPSKSSLMQPILRAHRPDILRPRQNI